MRKVIYILASLIFLTAGFCAVSCSQNETDRAAPNLHLVREHVAYEARPGVTLPAGWKDARAREDAAMQAYYDAIDAGDEGKFLAAKRELREAAAAVQKLLPPPISATSQAADGGAR